MYVNLELSVNETFVEYRITVKVLATLKSPYVKGCHMIQKIESAVERVYLPQYFGNNFFLT